MGSYVRKERIKPLLRFLLRIVMVAAAVILVNALGIWIFLFSQGQRYILTFVEFLTALLLLEGSLIGVVGGFLFLASTMYRSDKKKASEQATAGAQAKIMRERRLSRPKWSSLMIYLGGLLILLALLIGFLTY